MIKAFVSGVVDFIYRVRIPFFETVLGNERCALHRAAMNRREEQYEIGKTISEITIKDENGNVLK
jgi:hypothetical protein